MSEQASSWLTQLSSINNWAAGLPAYAQVYGSAHSIKPLTECVVYQCRAVLITVYGLDNNSPDQTDLL